MKIAVRTKESAYKALEREFESTLVNELIPGILHNFANPLNGIMGRSKLLQRRMNEHFNKIKECCPDFAREIVDEQDKLSTDVISICKESDRFFYLFQDLASKFYVISDNRFERINLKKLIENELRFLEFYLDFKHEIKKTIKLTSDMPWIYGTQSGYSLCFSALLRNSMYRMKKSETKELSIITDCDERNIMVVIQDTGAKMIVNTDSATEGDSLLSCNVDMSSLVCVQLLFKEYNVKSVFEGKTGWNRVTLQIPVNRESST